MKTPGKVEKSLSNSGKRRGLLLCLRACVPARVSSLLWQAEYLGEDGEWYFYYTGQDGQSYNLTHVFYATEQDHVNIAKIQSVRLLIG